MDLTNRIGLKSLLQKYGTGPKKSLGQHFLSSKRTLKQIIEAADIKKGDVVVEVGPGIGTLTQELAKTGAKIIAVEKDVGMLALLDETLKDFRNIEIVTGDILDILNPKSQITNSKQIPKHKLQIPRHYKVVANLPYYVATAVIRKFLETKNPPEHLVVMVQKEVAQRICARPPHTNLLAVSMQFYADVKIVSHVPAEVFWPKPKVDSAVLLIKPRMRRKIMIYHNFAADEIFEKRFFEIVKAGFSQPRKQLLGNLIKKLSAENRLVLNRETLRKKIILIFRDLNIPEKARAENLTVEDWSKITEKLIEN